MANFAFSRSRKKNLAIGSFFLLIGSGMVLIYPQAVRIIIDEALNTKDISKINLAGIIFFLIFLLEAVVASYRYYLFTVVGEKIVKTLREQLYERIIVQDIAFFDSTRTGELMSRLSSDTTVLQNTVSVNISQGLRNILGCIGGIILLVYTSPILSLVVLALIPPIAIGITVFGRKISVLSKKKQDTLADATVVAEETISGIRTVRAFAQEPKEAQRYRSSLDEHFDIMKRLIYQIAIFTSLASIIGYIGIVTVIWYGGRQVVLGSMTVGGLTSFLLYMLTVTFSVASLSTLWTDFMNASGAATRIFELLDRQPKITTTGTLETSWEAKVCFQDVDFFYPSRQDIQVLHKINLTINPGEMIALVGPSGSGKSTIAHLILHFYEPTSGIISIAGHDIRKFDSSYLRKKIGLVAQEPALLSTTILENILYGRTDATTEEVIAAAKAANALEFIQNFPEGVNTVIGEKGVQLSGGQKQRVAIARAILKDPSLLILDEATSALDAESEYLVQEALARLMKNRTTLVIAHRLSTVRHADLVVVLESGKIVQMGKHDALTKEEGLYRRLVARQFIGTDR